MRYITDKEYLQISVFMYLQYIQWFIKDMHHVTAILSVYETYHIIFHVSYK